MPTFFSTRFVYHMELAHRLNHEAAPSKCVSIHGHSWEMTWHLAPTHQPHLLGVADMSCGEFGVIKRALRAFIDEEMDHALALHKDDPMVGAIRAVYPEQRFVLLDGHPTTETLAAYILAHTHHILAAHAPHVSCSAVTLRETHANTVEVSA